MYPLVAIADRYPDDYSVSHSNASQMPRWHDGEPLTADGRACLQQRDREQSVTRITLQACQLCENQSNEHEFMFTFTRLETCELRTLCQLLLWPKHLEGHG